MSRKERTVESQIVRGDKIVILFDKEVEDALRSQSSDLLMD